MAIATKTFLVTSVQVVHNLYTTGVGVKSATFATNENLGAGTYYNNQYYTFTGQESYTLYSFEDISDAVNKQLKNQRAWQEYLEYKSFKLVSGTGNNKSPFKSVYENRFGQRITIPGQSQALGDDLVGQAALFYASGGGLRGFSSMFSKVAAKTGSRAFFSGAGTEARAIEQGFQTLGQTRAGQNLAKLTAGMDYYPGSQAYNMWGRLSATYAKGIPKGSTVNVFLNNPSSTGIWNAIERPILEQRGINIIFK